MKLLQELFANGILSEAKRDELQKEIEKTGKKEEEIILDKKIISEGPLFELKSKIFKMPLKKIRAEDVPPEVLEIIPEEAAINYKMSAISKSGNTMVVGMVYPEDVAAQNALRFLSVQENINYQVCLITLSNLAELLKQRKTISIETKRALEELNKEKGEEIEILGEKMASAEMITDDAPIIKMVMVILRHALEGNASDIHIEPGRDKLTIRFRQNGILHPSLFLPLKVHPSIAARIKILSGLKIDENRIPQDGRFSAKIHSVDIDFRVATFPTLYGEKVEMRVLDPSVGIRSFDDLGLRGRSLEVVKEATKKPYGMILFTGPTGSGKTTTLYAFLKKIQNPEIKIITIEDPIEYHLKGVSQTQVSPEKGYTFADGLRSIVRQDPDVILVGEIRDLETAKIALQAALTGHLVLSTLHTNDAAGTIPRLVDLGTDPSSIASGLKMAVAQRLVRKVCKQCSTLVKPTADELAELKKGLKSLPKTIKTPDLDKVMVAKTKDGGCAACNFTGYKGRQGLFEAFLVDSQMEKFILTNPPVSSVRELAIKKGMVTMYQSGLIDIALGVTTFAEVARVVEEDEESVPAEQSKEADNLK